MSRATQLVSGSWGVNPGPVDFTGCIPNLVSRLVLYPFENLMKITDIHTEKNACTQALRFGFTMLGGLRTRA